MSQESSGNERDDATDSVHFRTTITVLKQNNSFGLVYILKYSLFRIIYKDYVIFNKNPLRNYFNMSIIKWLHHTNV